MPNRVIWETKTKTVIQCYINRRLSICAAHVRQLAIGTSPGTCLWWFTHPSFSSSRGFSPFRMPTRSTSLPLSPLSFSTLSAGISGLSWALTVLSFFPALSSFLLVFSSSSVSAHPQS